MFILLGIIELKLIKLYLLCLNNCKGIPNTKWKGSTNNLSGEGKIKENLLIFY